MVHVWLRGEKFIARGYYQQKPFGVTVGQDKQKAEAGLRRLLTEIEDGKFSRASERPPRLFPISPIGRLTLRELCDRCLQEKRRLRGLDTTKTYQQRLSHVLDHAERAEVSRRWPLARNLDRAYAVELRAFLSCRQVARNGRNRGTTHPMSDRQIRNVLDALKMVLDWAVRADVRLLPVEFLSPITPEILGASPVKDPLRRVALPLPARIAMLERMDDWQFENLAALLVLPLRPEDVARALISDVDFTKGELRLGDHFDGCDYSKGKVNVSMPLPQALIDLFRVSVGGRAEGPLFLTRVRRRKKGVRLGVPTDLAALRALLDHRLSQRGVRDVPASADRKRVYCELLEKLGGATTDELGREIRKLLPEGCSARPYDLRHGVTQDMYDSGIRHLEMRYLTAHTTRDILNEYITLDPSAEMQKYYARCEPLLKLIEERVRRLADRRSVA